jgi:hypothetical protein
MSYRSNHEKPAGWPGILAAACAAVLLAACQTSPDATLFDQAPLIGVVFDGGSTGVQGFTVILDSAVTVTSDINGKFSFPAVARGRHRMDAHKDGHCSVSLEFDFASRSQILYITSLSWRDYLSQAETALQRLDYPKAAACAEAALGLRPGDPVTRYLLATVETGTGNYDAAFRRLMGLLDDKVRETAVYLLLADIAALWPERRDAVRGLFAGDRLLSRQPEIARAMERLETDKPKETP